MATGLQDAFLNECKRQGTAVTLYLMNGFQLCGIVKGYDPFTVLLEYEGKPHLIYKHAISTICAVAHIEVSSSSEASLRLANGR
jgi:host factor-I protein